MRVKLHYLHSDNEVEVDKTQIDSVAPFTTGPDKPVSKGGGVGLKKNFANIKLKSGICFDVREGADVLRRMGVM